MARDFHEIYAEKEVGLPPERSTGLDCLAIGNCFLEKESQDQALAKDYTSEFAPD